MKPADSIEPTSVAPAPDPCVLYVLPVEREVLLLLRKIQFGRIEIVIEYGTPVLVRKTENIRLK